MSKGRHRRGAFSSTKGLHAIAAPPADNRIMAKVRWAVPCTAHRKNGRPCSAFAITGGYVCVTHGGAAPQVRAAAARRWEFERMMVRIERGIERRLGRPVDPFALAWMRAQFAADPATFRRHRAAHDPTPWHPRVIKVNLEAMAGAAG
jgi:hypothetical protein